MADEGGGASETQMLVFVFGGFAILVFLWFATGGPAKSDLRGIFLNPPAPVGQGGAYGPTISAPEDTTNNQQQ